MTCEELVQRLLDQGVEVRVVVTNTFEPKQVSKTRKVAVGTVAATIEMVTGRPLGSLLTRGAQVLEFVPGENVLYLDAKVVVDTLAGRAPAT